MIAIQRRRVKISATIDPDLLRVVDAYVAEHPDTGRSKVIDEALSLWHARQQEAAMRAQFEDESGVDPEEWEAWRALRDAATARRLRPPEN
jgi:hypothetical protein